MKIAIFLITFFFTMPLKAHVRRYCSIQKLNNVYEIGLSNEYIHGDFVVYRWERGQRLSNKGEIYSDRLIHTSHAVKHGEVTMLEYTKKSKLIIQNILKNYFTNLPPFLRYSKLPHYVITVHLESPLPTNNLSIFKQIDDYLFPEGIQHDSIFSFECVDV